MKVHESGMSYIGMILSLSSIPDADRILRAEVVCGKGGRWSGVVRKGDVQEADVVVVFLPDSIVPETPMFAFMEPRGFRVRMMRLRGCPSEVLIMPMTGLGLPPLLEIGTDVTDILGVLKYEKEIPLSLSGQMAGAFPSFIPKTAELNFQKVPEMRLALVGHECTISTKYDGSSQTFYHRDGHIGGCSRNWELKDVGKTAVWDIAHRYELPERLLGLDNYALQWEAVGPGVIRGNPLKLTRIEPRVFDVFDTDAQRYLDYDVARSIVKALGLPFVDAIRLSAFGKYTDDDLRQIAEGVYAETGGQREGVVIRPAQEMRVQGERLSFRVINLLYRGN